MIKSADRPSFLSQSPYVFFAALTVALSALVALPNGAKADIPGWCLLQRQPQLGVQKVYLTPSAIKIVNQTLGFTVLAVAPKWRLMIFRKDDRIAYEGTIALFQKNNFGPMFALTGSHILYQYAKRGESKVDGLRLEIRKSEPNDVKEVWAIKSIDVAPQALKIIQTYYQLDEPVLPFRLTIDFGPAGIPLSKRNLWLGTSVNEAYVGRTTFIDTLACQKQTFRSAEFQYPTGYKLVKAPLDAMVSKATGRKFENMLRVLDGNPTENSSVNASPHR